MADADNKTCTKCRELKPVSDYARQGKGKRNARCKSCVNAERKGYYGRLSPEVREGQKHRARARRYNLTVDEYAELLRISKCQICGNETPGGHGEWHIDHNHETGKVRGILCSSCNLGLGHFKDNMANLERAIAYLEVTDG